MIPKQSRLQKRQALCFLAVHMKSRRTGRSWSCPCVATAPHAHCPHGSPMTPTSCHANVLYHAEGAGWWVYASIQYSLSLHPRFYSTTSETRSPPAYSNLFRPVTTLPVHAGSGRTAKVASPATSHSFFFS